LIGLRENGIIMGVLCQSVGREEDEPEGMEMRKMRK